MTLGTLDDLGVTAGNILSRDDDVAGGIAPEHQRRSRDRVFATIGERDDSPTRVAGNLAPFCLGLGLRHCLREVHGLDVLGAPTAPLVDEGQFLTADLNLVAMEEWRRLRAEAYAV